MKALSIVSPGGTRIASGLKTLEVRRWTPQILPLQNLLIVENDRFLREDGDQDPDGRAVALVDVTSVRPFVEADITAACASAFETGWLAWQLTNVRPITSPTKILAARGIYDISFDPETLI